MAEIVVVHGYPGSGKTTQCERVAQEGLGERGVQHVSVGNRLRAIKSHAVISQFSNYINSPEAPHSLPDEVVRGAIFEALEEPTIDEFVLGDGYPRYSHAINDFYTTLQANNHTFLGTIEFDIAIATSIERAVRRGHRGNETMPEEVLESFAAFRYNRHKQTTHMAIMALSSIAPVEIIDASGNTNEVYGRFTTALGRLALDNKELVERKS